MTSATAETKINNTVKTSNNVNPFTRCFIKLPSWFIQTTYVVAHRVANQTST